jgi:flavorubredoxin
MKAAKNAVIITSDPNGIKGLKAHYGADYPFRQVKAGDSLSLGKRTLTFVSTPMLHWPDNMVTYCPEEKILFSNDAFGQHYTSTNPFDDMADISRVFYEAKHYYANILMPFAVQAKKALAVVEGLDIEIIAPSHGVIWRKYIKQILELYHAFSDGACEDTALVIYDTMWHSTESMAHSIAEGFARRGTKVILYNLKVSELSDIVTDALTARYLVIGSPTLNNGIMPNVRALLTYLKGLSPKGKRGFAFGSYGWSGQSTGIINQSLVDMGVEILMDPVRISYIPSKEQLAELENKVAAIE